MKTSGFILPRTRKMAESTGRLRNRINTPGSRGRVRGSSASARPYKQVAFMDSSVEIEMRQVNQEELSAELDTEL